MRGPATPDYPVAPMATPSFRTTRWSLVHAAGADGDPQAARAALEELCAAYWYPLYAYLRRSGQRPQDAEDLVQGFLTGLVQRNPWGELESDGARFRSWLLAGLKNHVVDRRRQARAAKRGGDRTSLPFDVTREEGERRFAAEPAAASTSTPEALFERRWALTVLERALDALEHEEQQRGQGPRLQVLRPFLIAGAERAPHAALAERLGTSAAAVRVAVHRLRSRYGELLLGEVRDTLGPPASAADGAREEVGHLYVALGEIPEDSE